MKFAYYPGCSQQASAIDYGMSTLALCSTMGIQLEEIPGWCCCGSSPAHSISEELAAALSARNLDLAARRGFDTVVTPCPSCLSNLRAARARMRDGHFRERVNGLLDEPAPEDLPEAISVIQAIARRFDARAIQGHVKKGLAGLRLACYYGCLMSRPPEIMNFGDPENPTLMESLLAACGAEMVDFPLKTVCCGASYGVPEQDLTAINTGRILELARNVGVDALVVACPLCQMNLDLRQRQADAVTGEFFQMPVPYYSQLMGLAFGIAPQHLGLDRLCVSPVPLLAKIGVEMTGGLA